MDGHGPFSFWEGWRGRSLFYEEDNMDQKLFSQERKPYSKPELVKFGNAMDLIKGGTSSGSEYDPNTGQLYNFKA